MGSVSKIANPERHPAGRPPPRQHPLPKRAISRKGTANPMNPRDHWEAIYRTKPADQVSWFAPHLHVSLDLLDRVPLAPSAAILDVGGGASTLVDDLVIRGFTNLTVLDLSPAALDAARARLGPAADGVRWLAADITQAELAPAHYDLWHDRAVFHFLTATHDRAAYIRQLVHALRPGGHAAISFFGPEGPTRCSGLDVIRYDAPTLAAALGSRFRLLETVTSLHATPSGTSQQFLSCLFRLD